MLEINYKGGISDSHFSHLSRFGQCGQIGLMAVIGWLGECRRRNAE